MTEQEYRSHPAISRSELWWMDKSPEYFQYRKNNPMEPTPSLLFGQVAHKLLLEPADFSTDFAVAPAVDRRTRDGKAALEEFLLTVGERKPVDAATYEQASDMIAAARMVPLVNELLDGDHEVPLFWTDPDTGVECKCRLDSMRRDDNGVPVVVDYKTTNDASYKAFLRDVVNYGYYFQAAMYSEGVIHNNLCPKLIKGKAKKRWAKSPETGRRKYWTEYEEDEYRMDSEDGEIVHPRWIFIVQEKAEPYSVNICEMEMDFITAGYDKYRELIGTYVSCLETDYWPGYMGVLDEPNILSLPSWLINRDE